MNDPNFVQATGAIQGGGTELKPRTPMQRKELADFSYRMARIIARDIILLYNGK
jgi:hypothetical protein